jgi:outer membrane protein assembly factor BamB
VLLSTYSGNPDNTYGVYLTKISFTGNIIWEKEIFSGFFTWGPNITSDSENAIVILCSQTLPPDHKFYSRLAKLDSDGNLLWSNDFYPEILNQPETIITDRQDKYIAIVDSITDHYGAGETRISVPIVNKINSDGTTLWTKTLDSDNGLAWMTRAAVDNDNNIIIAHQPGSKNVVLKLDPSGNMLWKKILTNDIISFERMREITIDNENNIYIIGDSNAPKWVALIRISPDGAVLNKKLYYKDPSEDPDNIDPSEYLGNSVKYVPDNKLVVLATEYSPFEAAVFYMTNGFDLL